MAIYFKDPETNQEYSIRFKHFRNPGASYCDIFEEFDNNERYRLSEGVSNCHPNDNFCYETGRKLALKYALIETPLSFRTTVWKAYFARTTTNSNR